MISKFDDFLKEGYLNSKKILENEFIYEINSEVFLIMLLLKEDSLLNCLIKSDYLQIIKLIKSYNLIEPIGTIEYLIDKAYTLACKDGLILIGDEHLLQAIITDNECNAYQYLKLLNIDLDKVLDSVNNYFEFEENDYLVDLTNISFNPFVGRSTYIDKIIRILNKKQKNNCMLIGSAGVGKSALVEGVIMELMKKDKSVLAYRLELGVIVAGTRYRGDLEERLVEVIKKVKEEKAILFIDEIHNIVSHSKGEDTLNIANILKPILARNEIKCIGATTLDEYYEHIQKDKALSRRFQNIFIPEATEEETLEILNNIKSKYESFYNIKYPKYILKDIIKNCVFMPNRKFPDKAIDILDEIGALVSLENRNQPSKKDIKKIALESIGLDLKNNYNKVTYNQLIGIYKIFTLGLPSKTTIANINFIGNDPKELISDCKYLFNVRDEAVIYFDFELFDEYSYNYLCNECKKFPILIVNINNFDKGNYYYQSKIKKIFEVGSVYNSNLSLINFRNCIFIFKEVISKEIIGFNNSNESNDLIDVTIYEQEKAISNDLDNFINHLKDHDIKVTVAFEVKENLNCTNILKDLYKEYNPNKKQKYLITKDNDKICLKKS